MITIDSSLAQPFGHGAVKSLLITGGRFFWNRQSWNELRLIVRKSPLACFVLAIIVALIVSAGLQMLGVFDFVAGWSVLRNVSGWVGPAAAVGAAGAAAAAAGAGSGGPDGDHHGSGYGAASGGGRSNKGWKRDSLPNGPSNIPDPGYVDDLRVLKTWWEGDTFTPRPTGEGKGYRQLGNTKRP